MMKGKFIKMHLSCILNHLEDTVLSDPLGSLSVFKTSSPLLPSGLLGKA